MHSNIPANCDTDRYAHTDRYICASASAIRYASCLNPNTAGYTRWDGNGD